MAAFIERTRCPLCESPSLTTLLSRDFAHASVCSFIERYYAGRVPPGDVEGHRYEVARCARCQLLFQRYILGDEGMACLYESWISAEESFAKLRASAGEARVHQARQIEAAARLVGGIPHEKRFLDFGTGWGYWPALARAYGFQALGVELSETRRKYARQLGVEALATLREIPRASIDFANCEQVLEHVADPLGCVREIASVLVPGGFLRVSVPNAQGMVARLLRTDWSASKDALHPLEHVNGFTHATLERLGGRADLSPIPLPRLAPPRPGMPQALRAAAIHAWQARRGTCVWFAKPRFPARPAASRNRPKSASQKP